MYSRRAKIQPPTHPLAATPPLGFNSWNRFGAQVSAAASHGNLIPDPKRFPGGRKPVADVVHGLALLKRGSSKARIGFTAGEIGLLDGTTGVIRDLWKQEDVAALGVKPVFETEVCPHAAVLLKLTCLKNHSSALSTCRRGALRQAQGAGA